MSSNPPSSRRLDRDWIPVAGLAALVSLLSLLACLQRGQILLYGDAVAHINIARRVFDSQTPGLLQLGTVWLPLPHLLMVPFLFSGWVWQTGVGGSIPSMIAYVFGVVGMFRLVRGVLVRSALAADHGTVGAAQSGGWVAAFVFGANPNLTYLQATAMTESLYLALFVWAVVHLAEFLADQERITKDAEEQKARNGLPWKCIACLAGAELTRYDGWFLAAVIGAAAVVLAARRWNDRAFRVATAKFVLAVAIAPLFWLAYNAAVYGNPLEFANGKYSARAIEQRAGTVNPAAHDVKAAASYFLKSAELNMAAGNWGRIWIGIALAGQVLIFLRLRTRGALLLFWIPLAFYALSIAYGSVPLFLPAWWPFTWYNLRYGVQLLPLFATSAGMLAARAYTTEPQSHREGDFLRISVPRWWIFGLVWIIVAAGYLSVWKAQPLCFTEAWVNSRTRMALESVVASKIGVLPPESRYLMYTGEHVGIFEQLNVPLRRVVNEGNHRPWRRPSDPEGIWERALADPACCVDYVIAFAGDPVDSGVNKNGLVLLNEIHASGQPQARIYAAQQGLNQSR